MTSETRQKATLTLMIITLILSIITLILNW